MEKKNQFIQNLAMLLKEYGVVITINEDTNKGKHYQSIDFWKNGCELEPLLSMPLYKQGDTVSHSSVIAKLSAGVFGVVSEAHEVSEADEVSEAVKSFGAKEGVL